MSRQRLGQHFLSDAAWRARIAQTLGGDPADTWLEIGAGHGEMTEILAQKSRRVIAVETDATLAAGLRDRARHWQGVEVLEADVLSLDLETISGDPFRIYGNLPYYITSPILSRLFRFADRIESIHVVVQFEVAARIAARPGSRAYGYLSTLCQFYAQPEILLRIPPGAFHPRPRVTSALVEMRLPGECAALGVADEARFLAFLGKCFAQKRKTLRNNLRAILPEQRVEELLAACRIRRDARAEQFPLAQFAALFSRIESN